MAVSLSLLAGAGWQFLDDNANPLTGGLLYTYAAGTTTPLATYTSSSGSTPNANPIVLDAAGRVSQEVWLTVGSDYKFILKNSAGVTIWTKDDIPGGLSSDAVTFLQAGTGAVVRTAQAKMRDVVSVKDFGAVGNGVADDTAAIQNAINTNAGEVFFPVGNYKISGPITCVDNQTLFGPATITLYESNSPFFFNVSSRTGVTFKSLRFAGRRASWVYPWTIGNNSVDSRSRYSAIYGLQPQRITVEDCHFTEMYSAAIYLVGGGLVSEKAVYNYFRIINSSCTSSNLELTKLVELGDILVQGCRTANNSNTSGLPQFLGNGMITTACNDVRVEGCYFGASQGAGCKIESVNGATNIVGNTCDMNDAGGVLLQQSGAERGDVANHNERVTISGNVFIRPSPYGVGAESSNADAVWNTTVTGNTFFGCVQGGMVLSGKNWVVTGNTFCGPSVNRVGAAVNPYGILINQDNGNSVSNVTISGNTFDINNAALTAGVGEIVIGYVDAQNMTVRDLNIVGNTIRNSDFRGIYCLNNIDASSVLVAENVFYRDTLDGNASRDIYVFNANHAVRWTVCNNTTAQGITVNLTNAGSYAAVFNNKINATESKDTANGYVVSVNGNLATIFDLGRRVVGRAAAAPVSGEWEVGDLIWDSAPIAGGTMGWVCTTGGTPGTWKTFGTIAP